MSRFNAAAAGTKTVNLAGGESFDQSKELKLISILLTSFAQDSFYQSSNNQFAELKKIIDECDNEFIAKAIIYARNEFGMRSISHVASSLLAKKISGQKYATRFFDKVIKRVDDITEIIAYHQSSGQKISNAMKKGFSLALGRFDKYELAKYRGSNKSIKLVDAVNLIHPKPNEKNSEALSALIRNELRSFDTWENELTAAGQAASNDQEKETFKKDAWIKLIKEKKIGYFALLKNLRNIIEQAPEIIDDALIMLQDENRIQKSLVLPFRYLTAYEEINKLSPSTEVRQTLIALNKAVDLAVKNVPVFNGETLVVLDVSGSMEETNLGNKSPHIIGSLFSSVLIKSNNCDFMVFSDEAKYININPLDSTITIANQLKFATGGTNFHSIFQTASRKYDRIIILSDMQGWIGRHSPVSSFNEYKKRTNSNPFIYSFDLKGYGSMQFPERNVFCIAGFSEKVFNIMKLMEHDKNALVNTIKNVEL